MGAFYPVLDPSGRLQYFDELLARHVWRIQVITCIVNWRPKFIPGLSGEGSKSDPPLWGFRWLHQGADRVEDHAELFVILLFERIKLAGKFLVGYKHPPDPDKRPHDGNIHLNRLLAFQNAGKHGDTLLGKNVRKVSASTP